MLGWTPCTDARRRGHATKVKVRFRMVVSDSELRSVETLYATTTKDPTTP